MLGIDANSPKVDHPDVARNVYFSDPIVRDQGEPFFTIRGDDALSRGEWRRRESNPRRFPPSDRAEGETA